MDVRVTGLPAGAAEEDLRAAFAPLGAVERVWIARAPAGLAFVTVAGSPPPIPIPRELTVAGAVVALSPVAGPSCGGEQEPGPKLATLVAHTEPLPAAALQGLSTPITLASTYRLSSAAHGARLCEAAAGVSAGADGFLYSRWGNPTTEAAAATLSRVEGAAAGSLLFASGMGAISAALASVLRAGAHVVAPACCYSGTYEFLTSFARDRMGVAVTFVDDVSVEAYAAAATPATAVLYVESPANPSMRLTDLEAVGALAQRLGVPLLVDGTFATAFHTRSLDYEGVMAVVNSCTKYYGGHSDVLCGSVSSNDRAFMAGVAHAQRVFGGGLPAMDAFLLQRGLKTLAVRMRAHAGNALELARRLERHPAVLRVAYPGLQSHPDHALARRQMRGGFGGMMSFEVAGGVDAGRAFVEALSVVTLAVSLGSVESLVEHPASMTHTMVAAENRRAAGISDGLIRLSVGIEDVEDLWGDIGGALDGLA